MATGPLTDTRIIEVAGLGPSPFCALLLADMGAEVLRIDRAASVVPPEQFQAPPDVHLNRGRRSIGLDLKNPDGVATLLRLIERADALTEGFRPGVMERLGLGPEQCMSRNPALIYGRMTGWGQDGPAASAPGHDINYVARAGILHAIGRAGQPPTPPLNIVGDFGGGGMLLAFGIVCGLLEAGRSGRGQVVDASMLDGSALLGTLLYGMHSLGEWSAERGTNLLDSGAPFYDVYGTSDGHWISIAAIEPQFYANLIRELGLDGERLPDQMDRASWPAMKERFAAIFRTRTRAQWSVQLEDAEVCFSPVLSVEEAAGDSHNAERRVLIDYEGVTQPAPAPRFSRTPGAIQRPAAAPGQHTDQALADWGFSSDELALLRQSEAIA